MFQRFFCPFVCCGTCIFLFGPAASTSEVEGLPQTGEQSISDKVADEAPLAPRPSPPKVDDVPTVVGTKQARQSLEQQDARQEQRFHLWNLLLDACPPKYRKITAYGENDDLSVVCFRSERTTLMFRARTAKVEPVIHKKVIPQPVNRITYREDDRGQGRFQLWHNGELELTISSPD